MARIKIQHITNYTVVQNDFIYDTAISTFDKGLLLVMLSKKDDYNFSIARIAKEIKETRAKVSKSLKAIEDAGYLRRVQQTHNSKFGEMIYYVADEPCFKNSESNDENSTAESRDTENESTESGSSATGSTADGGTKTQATLSNTNISSTNISNTKKSSIKNIKQPKKKFAESVWLTEQEYQTLCKKHSKTFADKCIEVLNNYKLANGKKYKSDYHAILNWVEERVQREFPYLFENNAVSEQSDPYANPFEKYF
jgi:predicted transcriptional regulator